MNRKERRHMMRANNMEAHINANAKRAERPIFPHVWDEDACCIHCGYDGAEGWHLKSLGYGPEEYGPMDFCEQRALKERK